MPESCKMSWKINWPRRIQEYFTDLSVRCCVFLQISLATTSTLLLAFLVNQARAHGECQSLDFIRRSNRALAGHVFKRLPLDVQGCMTECAKTVGCFSINAHRSGNGDQHCELLGSSTKSSPRNLVPRPGCEHLELTVSWVKCSGCTALDVQ